MNHTITEFKEVTVITLGVRRATAEIAKEFKELLFDLIENKKIKKILLDMTMVEFADSSFLGAIVSGLKKSSLNKGDIKIFGLQPSVDEMFKLTRLFKVFEIFENRDEAIDSFPVI
ncbi:MAG: STAS domain-containing protein [Ignavibacteria bacterium]|nr:STAS domain-containing protein [Ignavibacteria bacterium]